MALCRSVSAQPYHILGVVGRHGPRCRRLARRLLQDEPLRHRTPQGGESRARSPGSPQQLLCLAGNNEMSKKDYWVSPTGDGNWSVKREGASRAANVFGAQAQASARARELARRAGGERITQKRDGTIGSKDSYGNDPRRRRDTEN